MTFARRQIYNPTENTFFHCISRCVRRAFLCGIDSYTSKSFEHRKEWVRELLSELASIFSVELLAYAVMSNHLHTVLRTRHDAAMLWSAEEVARRWRILFPLRNVSTEPTADELLAITSNPKLVETYRQRLGNLSWFHRCLNERLARRANAEDECTGRFWEGRFRSIRLEEDAAVLACSIYVDLNPIRAGVARTPEASDYTSIQDRVRQLKGVRLELRPRLLSISKLFNGELTEESYIELVAETGAALIRGKRSLSPAHHTIIRRFGMKPDGWIDHAKSHSKLFHRIAGSCEALKKAARNCRRNYFQGLKSAERIFA